MRLIGKVVAVTGAGGGIGRQLAVGLVSRGSALAVSDQRADSLDETVHLAQKAGGNISAQALDVTDCDMVHSWAKSVVSEFGRVDVLINNAGVTLPWRALEEVTLEQFRRIVEINLWGAVHTTLAFLPLLRERPEAAIVNVGSLASLVAFPKQVGYCTSKFALRGFTEGLHSEMAGSRVHVTLVLPGSVRGTGIMRNALGTTPAEVTATEALQNLPLTSDALGAADKIIVGIERNRHRVIIGKDARILGVLARLFPASYPQILRPMARSLERRIEPSDR
jgi:NAD(P)-dependent dehydrogenase (short-subunit alcohol dehydrogenase family)